MTCMLCSNGQKRKDFTPPEINKLKLNPNFQGYSEEDLMSIYVEFRNMTRGKECLDQEQFIEFMKQLNVT